MAKTTPSASQPPNNKRKKSHDDSDHNLDRHNTKKRVRVSYSCSECHRRKQKCDRQSPCSHCVARKVPHLCKAYTPGKSEQDIEHRLSRLEHIIEMALPSYCANGLSPGSHEQDDDGYSQVDETEQGGGGLQSDGKWYGVSATGSVAPSELLHQIQSVTEPGSSSSHQLAAQLPSSSQHMADRSVVEPSTSSDILQTLINECGVKPTNINELMAELPSPLHSDALINYYFKDVNWTRYPISESDFRSAYLSLLSHRAEGSGNTNTNDICFLGLLFVVLAIAARVAPDEIVEPSQRRVTSMRYYWASRRSVLIAAAIQPDTLWMILTRLLSARFLTFDRRITECWSQLGAAVRTAQALGLHRDAARMGMDPHEVEYRRRIWSYLYHADRSYSLVLGRPTSIQDYYTSTQVPSNILPGTSPGSPDTIVPLTSPTPYTFVILRHQLAVIIGKITHHYQQITGAGSYAEVLALDDELSRFMQKLPPHYSLDPDSSLDAEFSYIPVHRFLLITEVLFVRTSLHRPYLLRKLKSPRYNRSRTACYESALSDFRVRSSFRLGHSPSSQRALGNGYREFQMAMISGIYLIMESDGVWKADMEQIMERFMEDCRLLFEQGEGDETTKRELKIVEFLKSKGKAVAQTVGKNGSSAVDSAVAQQDQDARLLLSLGQPSSPSLQQSPQHSSFNPLTGLDSSSAPPSLSSPTFSPSSGPQAKDSPSAEEDSTAQFLLDNWYNSMNGGPQGDGFWDGGIPVSSLSTMGTMPAQRTATPLPIGLSTGQVVSNSASNMNGVTHGLPNGMSIPLSSLDSGGDWNYWETLLSHIQPGS